MDPAKLEKTVKAAVIAIGTIVVVVFKKYGPTVIKKSGELLKKIKKN